MVKLFIPIEIKAGIWKLTIYDGNMFQSNEIRGFFFQD